MALIIGMPVVRTRPGTTRKPPPMPKKPAVRPTASAIATRNGTECAFCPASAVALALPQHQEPDAIIRTPKNSSSTWPATALPMPEPIKAPKLPAIAKMIAVFQCTVPARA